jgi:GntR family transcriptional regulator, transcriptional repressor for pyruvate dehydrogenase complex
MINAVSSATHSPRFAASRVSRAEAVARDVEAEILGEGIPPGERLGTKEELRQRFGVAVATVNEAVRLLETRGLIEARPGPGGGVFVARSSVRVALKRDGLDGSWGGAPFSDCLAVRNCLEPIVCHEAALHHTDEDIQALEKILAAMERHADEPRAYLELNWALHRRIAKLCRNAPLHSIYLTLIDFLEDGLTFGALNEFDGHDDAEVHRQLVAAIDAGPGPHLDAAIERHERIPTLLVQARRPRRTAGSRAS